MVTIKCYNKETQMERKEAIRFYKEAVACCEGSERDRYMNVLMDLLDGKDYCTDEEDYDNEF